MIPAVVSIASFVIKSGLLNPVITAAEKSIVQLIGFKPKNEKIAMFLGSDMANVGKCRVDFNDDGKFELNIPFIGEKSDFSKGLVHGALNFMICGLDGEISTPFLDLNFTRKFEASQAKCSYASGNKVVPFGGNGFYNHGNGPHWYLKAKTWAVQTHESPCITDKTKNCITSVAIRVLSSLWVAHNGLNMTCASITGCDTSLINMDYSNGQLAVKLPGNIDVSLKFTSLGYTVTSSIPGQNRNDYLPSLCNYQQLNDTRVLTPVLEDELCYFQGQMSLPPQKSEKKTPFLSCELPKSCKGAIPWMNMVKNVNKLFRH